ncbi:flagellar basal body rod protein FlgC [Rickettsia endosymbiont of Cardiosporidium cionae]|uniref:flagellar basal body rod protein FlgC n=1 Tax=Rickettsia endosymbiont of Cardiosporidium cionae TaxID=2777155 RepID=UPI0018948C31|nr:flagellar basal body rod protein FlgC [Rickettsia endosymbiont of Cardiosporidium cionae]KAF8818611.1 hypothetical protein IHI24_000330 [Rickettsia endosymbiont of Cardiosporidium cionae]
MKFYKKFVFFVVMTLTSIPYVTFAKQDYLKHAIELAVYGNIVQLTRIKIATENLVNSDSTSGGLNKNPYSRRRLLVFNQYNKKKSFNIPKIKNIAFDKSPFILKFDPSHPEANANGYVAYPNVILQIEKADISEAQKSYEANLFVMEISNSLISKTIELIR